MLKMSEWAPQSLGGALAAGEALDPKGGPATQKITRLPLAVLTSDNPVAFSSPNGRTPVNMSSLLYWILLCHRRLLVT